jgi:hypothetical protein
LWRSESFNFFTTCYFSALVSEVRHGAGMGVHLSYGFRVHLQLRRRRSRRAVGWHERAKSSRQPAAAIGGNGRLERESRCGWFGLDGPTSLAIADPAE